MKTIEYGSCNLSNLILTTDKKLYEEKKAQGNISVLYEPNGKVNITKEPIYLIGIQVEK